MGTGTQTHIIFPRRAIPGVSWSPPLERANVPQPDAEGSREFATRLAELKAALEASPQQPPSPEVAARQQGSPSKLVHASAQPSPRSETVISPSMDGPSGGAAQPASIGSLIKKFEQAQQAAPKERAGLTPRSAALPSNGRAPERVHHDVEISSPSKPKWWQRLRRSKSRASAQGVPQPAARVDAGNAEADIDAIKVPEVSKSPSPKKPRRNSGKAASAAPILTWYRACVSAPETPPFLSDDNTGPLSARIAAHRGNLRDPPSIHPEPPADTPNSSTSEAEATQSLTSARDDSDVPGCSLSLKQDTDAGPRATEAASLLGHDSLGQCLQAEDASGAGQRAAEESQAAAFACGRSESLGQPLDAAEYGEASRKAAEAASLDIWLLPKEEELSARSVQQGRGSAAPLTPDLSPRTPEVARENAAASATPAARSSRLSRPPASAPREPAAGVSAQTDEDPNATTGAAVNEITGLSWPAAMAPGESGARMPTQAEARGVAAKTVPSREASEQLEAVRQLADQAVRVQRRARRLVKGRTGQKDAQGPCDSLVSQAADASRKRASNTPPPAKRARRKDGQRSRTPSPEKQVQQLLSDVTAVSEELRARSGRLGMQAAILGDLQSGIEAVRARLRTPSASPPDSDAAPEAEPSAAARTRLRPPPAVRASGAAAEEQQIALVMPDAQQLAADASGAAGEEQQAATGMPCAQQRSAAEAGADETAAPADASVAKRPSESAQPDVAQPAPAPVACTVAAPDLALEVQAHAWEVPKQAPDMVAEAAARARRAIKARRAARKERVGFTEEGTPSPEALQRSALDLARLSMAALTTSMCLLVSVEQGVEISARACEVVCNSLLARVPFGSALLQSISSEEEAPTRVQPSLAVRAIRGGIRMAYGAAGTVTGVGAGVLRAGGPPALPWRH